MELSGQHRFVREENKVKITLRFSLSRSNITSFNEHYICIFYLKFYLTETNAEIARTSSFCDK